MGYAGLYCGALYSEISLIRDRRVSAVPVTNSGDFYPAELVQELSAMTVGCAACPG